MITRASNAIDQRPDVLQHLAENRYPRVIDVGAERCSWARPYVTHCIDMFKPEGATEMYFTGDINNEEFWQREPEFALGHPPFDFAICTQTLEDLRNPQIVLRWLPRLAKRGYIDVPNKQTELRTVMENCDPETEALLGLDSHKNRGYIHHRWIFTIRDDKLVLYPKMPFIDRMASFDDWIKDQPWTTMFLSFWWENDLPFETWNNDYLGPDGRTVIEGYRNTLIIGL